MTDTAVLLCRAAAGVLSDRPPGLSVVIDDLCRRPAAAARAVRQRGASAVVIGLCEQRASSDLRSALRRAGVDPFAIEEVTLTGREPSEGAALLRAAVDRLNARVPGERGRAETTAAAVSRRALFSLSSVRDEAPIALVDRSACLGTARCGLCAEACPERAIDVRHALPEIDAAACSACGRCVSECPAGGVHLTGASQRGVEAQLEQALSAVSRIVFACAKVGCVAPPGSALIELPGLGALSAGWVVRARRRGAEVELAGCDGPCCAGAGAVAQLAAEIVGQGLETEPRGRLGLLTHVAERCTLCGACEAACPTGALRLTHSAGETVLVHDAAACAGCRLCVRACPEDALDVHLGLDVERLRAGPAELLRAGLEQCAGCGTELMPLPMRRQVALALDRPEAPLDLCARCAMASVGD